MKRIIFQEVKPVSMIETWHVYSKKHNLGQVYGCVGFIPNPYHLRGLLTLGWFLSFSGCQFLLSKMR